MKDNYESIIERCPLLYRHINQIECGPGWVGIIGALSDKLEKKLESYLSVWKEDELPHAVQVKEKYGKLRFCTSTCTEEMDKIVDEYEAMSAKTCEVCGKPGTLQNKGCLVVRCGDGICNNNEN